MRAGIFSDIHGNIYAFEKVWKALKKESCDIYFFLGDICGYYYYQNEIIDMLRGIENLVAVKGNHDDIFLQALNDKELCRQYTTKYGRAINLFIKNIQKEHLSFLKGLPDNAVIQQYSVCLMHGSPNDFLNGYVYPDDNLNDFQDLPYRNVFLGHTHYPMHKKVKGAKIINPGSCGQPRDYNEAAYAVFDFDSGKIRFKRVPYSQNSMIKDVLRIDHANNYLIEVLKRRKSK